MQRGRSFAFSTSSTPSLGVCRVRKPRDPSPRLPPHHGRASVRPHATPLASLPPANPPYNISKWGREKRKLSQELSSSESAAARFDRRHCTTRASPFPWASSSVALHLSAHPQAAHLRPEFRENLVTPLSAGAVCCMPIGQSPQSSPN